ncbi:hypothetical protein FRC01_005603 [Tulasnella sp. 417]|nr:hypothetical protein FRC01_005603 [Tulasnella sp. 417]
MLIIVGEGIIKLTYGKLEDDRGRDYIQISTRLMDIMVDSAQGYVVDLLPALRYLPKWLPGMQFKRDAARWKKEIRELEDTVFEGVKENIRMQDLYTKREEGRDIHQQREDEKALAYSGLQIFLAGLDTTEATVQSFIGAMILFPSVQEKARAEIDSVVGSGRFPTFEDQAHLPFLHAAILETLRWSPVASFGKSS